MKITLRCVYQFELAEKPFHMRIIINQFCITWFCFFSFFFSNNHFGRWIPIWNKFHLNLWLAIFKLKFHQMIFFWFMIHVQVNIPANSYFTWIISVFKLDIFYSEFVNSEVTHRFCENSFLNYQLIFIEKKRIFTETHIF